MGKKRFVDLSISIEADLPIDPPMMIPKIDYLTHEMGAEQMKLFFPGVEKKDLPGGLGWAVEQITLYTHSGTHMDAPYHYYPTMDNGQKALTIDEIPLEWCFNDGVLLDFRHKADGERITVEDVENELERIRYEIKPLDIVLIQTGADAAWGTEQYLVKGAGMSRESTLFLTEKGVKVVGIDAWSWDRPLPFQAADFKQSGDAKVIWEAHFAGIDIGYCHMCRSGCNTVPKIGMKSVPPPWLTGGKLPSEGGTCHDQHGGIHGYSGIPSTRPQHALDSKKTGHPPQHR